MTNDNYREEFEAFAGLDMHTEKWSTGSYKSSIHERSWQSYLAGRLRGEAEIKASEYEPCMICQKEITELKKKLKTEIEKTIADVAANCRASYLEELTHLRQQLNNLYFISAGIEVERNHLRQLVKQAAPYMKECEAMFIYRHDEFLGKWIEATRDISQGGVK